MLVATGCDAKPTETSAEIASAPVSAQAAASHVHSEDCSAEHAEPRRQIARARALNPADRARLTTLRVSAHVGSVTLRKRGEAWVVSAQQECAVPTARMERALDQLSALKAVPTDERPSDGASFELQIAALVGEERVLHFDVADRSADGDLVQLPDYTAFRVQGLDRELWSVRRDDWCTSP